MNVDKLGSIEVERNIREETIAPNRIYNRVFKPIIGSIFATVFFVCLFPVYIVIAGFILAETGLPVLYKAERGGYRGKKFKIYKFRTMVKNAEQLGGGTTALNDVRITRVGHILRKTKLDEITQLINIIKGEMCFIGPRPELIKYTSQYEDAEKIILQVRPGITDFSSIEFVNLDEIVGDQNADEIYEKYVLKKKNQLRIKYATTVNMSTDLHLFFITVFKVVRKAIRCLRKINDRK